MDQEPPNKRMRSDSSSSTSQRDVPPKSFFTKVADSVRDLFTPSWLVGSRSLPATSSAAPFEPVHAEEANTRRPMTTSHRGEPSVQTYADQMPYDQRMYEQPMSERRYTNPSQDSSVPIGSVAQTVSAALPAVENYRQRETASEPSLNGQRREAPSGYLPVEPSRGVPQDPMTVSSRMLRRNSYRTAAAIANESDRDVSTRDLDETTSPSRKRRFDVSSFAKSYSESMNSSMLNSSNLGNSSYYPGKTVYGGRSSVRTFTMPKATPYKRVTRVTKANNGKKMKSKVLDGTSTAAKIILKSLEKTGADHMKSIADGSLPNKLFTPAVYLRKRTVHEKSSPPVESLTKGSRATIVPNFRKQYVGQSSSASFNDAQSCVTRQSATPKQTDTSVCKEKRAMMVTRTRPKPYSKTAPVADDDPTINVSYSLQLEGAKPPQLNRGDFTSVSPSEGPAVDGSLEGSYKFSPPKDADAVATGVLPVSPSVEPFSFVQPSHANSVSKIFPQGLAVAKSPIKSSVANAAETVEPIASASGATASNWGDLMAKSDGKWCCSVCMVQNDKLVEKCVACRCIKPGTQSAMPAATAGTSTTCGWGDLLKDSANKWSCSTCFIQNDASVEKCVACGTQNPRSKPNKPQDALAVPATSGWGDLFKDNGNKWSCEACLIQNDATAEQCAACMIKKPNFKAVAPSSPAKSGWGDLFKDTASKWSCSVCCIQNDVSIDKCAACGASDPNKQASSKPSNAPASLATPSGWGNLFQQSNEKWNCETCFIQNDKDNMSCAACGAANPRTSAMPQKCTVGAETTEEAEEDSDGWGKNFPEKPGQWHCKTCRQYNPDDKKICEGCGRHSPSAAGSYIAVQPNKDLTGITAAGWDKMEGRWKCSICYVPNEGNSSLCVSCGAYKPGTQCSLGDLTKGPQLPIYSEKPKEDNTVLLKGFSFTTTKPTHSSASLPATNKLISTNSEAPTTGGFSPNLTNDASKPDAPGGFTIKITTPASKDDKASSPAKPGLLGGFTFKTSTPASKDDKASSPAKPGLLGGFTFKTSTTASKDDKPSSPAKPSLPGGFTFKTSTPASKDNKPSSPAKPDLLGGFTFKTSVTTPTTASDTGKPADIQRTMTDTVFGSATTASTTAPSTTAPILGFGLSSVSTNSQPATTKPTPPLFQFTATQPVQPEEEASQGPTVPTQAFDSSTFTFSAGQPSNGPSKPSTGFQFGASSFSASNTVQKQSLSFNVATTTTKCPDEQSDNKPIFSFGQLNKSANNQSNLSTSNSPFGTLTTNLKSGALKRGSSTFQSENNDNTANKIPAFQFMAANHQFRPAAPSYSNSSRMSHSNTSLGDAIIDGEKRDESPAQGSCSSTSQSSHSVHASDSNTSNASVSTNYTSASSNNSQRTIKRATRRIKK